MHWAVQVGLLTRLIFARHRLSSLAAFTSGAYFLHSGRRLQWIFEFYTANFKGILDAVIRMRLATINNLLHVLYDAPKCLFCPRTQDLLVSQKSTQRHFFPNLHPLSPVIFATATVVAFVLLRSSRFNFHCYTQREATPPQKSARKWRCDLWRLLARKITKGIHSCKPASLNRPTHHQSKLTWRKGWFIKIFHQSNIARSVLFRSLFSRWLVSNSWMQRMVAMRKNILCTSTRKSS